MAKQRKSPKARQLSFKDPVTGQKIVSDRYYGPNTKFVTGFKKALAIPDHYSQEYEFEVGKDFFVWNTIGTATESTPRPQYAEKSFNRIVVSGNFRVSKSGELSGRADTITQGNHRYAPWGDEFIGVASLGGRNFKNSAELYQILLSSQNESNLFFYEDPQSIVEYGIADYTGSPTKDGLAQFGLLKMFDGQWWNNPFASNLA